MNALVSAKGIAAGYNGQAVISDCSFTIEDGQAVAMVGRNGAGKTTLVSAISGRLPLLAGELTFAGRSIGRLPAYRRSRLGISHVPQGREMFAGLTVEENLRVAARAETRPSDWAFVYELFPILKARLHQTAGTLSGGEQQMVAIGRAVLTRASLMILDEPSLGLAPKVVESLFEQIERLRASLAFTLVLVEQQTRWIWQAGIVDYVYVLAEGTIATSGPLGTLSEAAIEQSYLGTGVAQG